MNHSENWERGEKSGARFVAPNSAGKAHHFKNKIAAIAGRAAVVLILLILTIVSARAATFVVDSTDDSQDLSPGNGVCFAQNAMCTLRAAIREANALSGDDIITLPAGTYITTLTGDHENFNQSGDLDITSNITINGAGSGSTFIQAAASAGTATERPLHVSVPTGSATVLINNVTLRYGRYAANGFFGGGFQVEGTGANVTLNNVVISDNQNVNSGGGIALIVGSPTLTMNACQISGNSINSETANTFGGGAVLFGGMLNLNDSSVTGNRANAGVGSFAFAGGIYNQFAALNVTNSIIANNTAKTQAGAVRTIAGNSPATTNINKSAIFNNTTIGEGSGLVVFSSGTANASLILNNSTVSGNTTAGSAGGLEIFATNAGNATAFIGYSTIAGNGANTDNTGTTDRGGGIVNFGQITNGQTGLSTVNLQSSAVADNTIGAGGAGPDISGAITSQGYNLVENNAGGAFMLTTGDITGIDPELGALAPNGGATLNHLPSGGSELLHKIPFGTNGCGFGTFTVDQRGTPRPRSSNCDIGAVERELIQFITARRLPNGSVNLAYSQTLSADLGAPPYSFSYVGGTIPPGLTLAANGTLSGTPTTAGTYTFTAEATDSNPLAENVPENTAENSLNAPNTTQKTFVVTIGAATAASVLVAGRATAANGRAVGNARVFLTDQNGQTRTTATNAFGYYRFENIAVGRNYVFNVFSKRYSFSPQTITVMEETTHLNFIAEP